MGGFLNAIFGGSNPTLNKDINQMGSLAGYSTGVGEGLVTPAAKFYEDILSGDPTKEAQAIAPETKAAQEQGQQEKNALAQFGTRSGGTASASAGIDANTRANLISLLGRLKSGAAGAAGQLGTANLGLAQQGTMSEADLAQQRFQNWMNSILGQGTGFGVGALEGFGLSKMLNPGSVSSASSGSSGSSGSSDSSGGTEV